MRKITIFSQLGSKLEAQEAPKSRPAPQKIDVKKQHVFDIDFSRVRTLFWNDLSQSPFGPLKSIKGRAKIHRNSNLEAKSGYNSMLEADKLEVGAQDEDFFAMLGQLGSNLEAQEAPKLTQKLEKIDVHIFSIDFCRIRNSFW